MLIWHLTAALWRGDWGKLKAPYVEVIHCRSEMHEGPFRMNGQREVENAACGLGG